MYNIEDKHFIDALAASHPEIHNHLQKIYAGMHNDLRNGCHDISNIISLIYGDYQLLALRHPELTGDERWNMLGIDIRNLIEAMRSIGEFRYAANLQPVNLSIIPYISGLDNLICSKTSARPGQLIHNYHMDDGIISIDADKINYVILALVRNVLDINKHAEIEISAYTDKAYLYIGITDFLGGLSSDIRARLFEPFNSDKTNNIGLSLATSFQILLNHSGELSYNESEGHSGSCFTLKVPLIS